MGKKLFDFFETLTSDKDPYLNPDPHRSTYICINLAPWIQIWIRTEIKKPGSESALKPMRIHNTAENLILVAADQV